MIIDGPFNWTRVVLKPDVGGASEVGKVELLIGPEWY